MIFPFRLSAAALAAFLSLTISTLSDKAHASLGHPDSSRLDPSASALAASSATAASGATAVAAGGAPAASPAMPAKSVPASKPEHGDARSGPEREEILSLARKGLLDSAYALSKAALAEDGENPFLLLMMGKLGHDGKESAEYLKKAIKAGGLSPEAEESVFRMGLFNYAAGKYNLAIPFFRNYLITYPSGDWKQPAQYWMGNACLSMAEARPDRIAYLDSGAAWFQKMLDGTKPEDYYHPLALEGLAKIKAAKGDREGAWEAARSALEKAPEEEQSPLLLLAAQIRQGVDRNDEKSLMDKLLARYPQSPEARYLRKLNAGVDTSRWKSGSGLPRPLLAAGKDSASAASGAETSAGKDTPKLPANGGYTLQLGAFSQAANAKAMMASVAKQGLTPELIESMRAGKPIYQVRIGRFASAEAAAEYARVNLKPRQFLSQPVPLGP